MVFAFFTSVAQKLARFSQRADNKKEDSLEHTHRALDGSENFFVLPSGFLRRIRQVHARSRLKVVRYFARNSTSAFIPAASRDASEKLVLVSRQLIAPYISRYRRIT